MVAPVLMVLTLIPASVLSAILVPTARLLSSHVIQILATMLPPVLIATQLTNASALMDLVVHSVQTSLTGVPIILVRMEAAVIKQPTNLGVTAQRTGLVSLVIFYVQHVK